LYSADMVPTDTGRYDILEQVCLIPERGRPCSRMSVISRVIGSIPDGLPYAGKDL